MHGVELSVLGVSAQQKEPRRRGFPRRQLHRHLTHGIARIRRRVVRNRPRYLVCNLGWCEYLRELACRVRHDCCPQSLMIRGVLSPDSIGVG
ncbi:hypothetical protein E3T50_07440 [Cryobacterium gelidum]|uniref:Uncharacterized protein n=1 Tax=Cryobacterium gelidum TaxID=1259164 RepID=A0A4V3IU82_9MICO|nr:hypothetical protein E3T50_07440 [Cryobacterium gelidum]